MNISTYNQRIEYKLTAFASNVWRHRISPTVSSVSQTSTEDVIYRVAQKWHCICWTH